MLMRSLSEEKEKDVAEQDTREGAGEGSADEDEKFKTETGEDRWREQLGREP